MNLKIILYSTTKNAWYVKNFSFIVDRIQKARGVKVDSIETKYVPFNLKTPVVKGGDGGVRIDWNYLKANVFEKGFNCVGYHITTKERKVLGLKHPTAGQLGGSYHREDDDVLDFVMIADKGQKAKGYDFDNFTRIFLHEVAHGFEYWTLGNSNVNVHKIDYELKQIHNIYALYDFTRYNLLTTLKNLLMENILRLLGQLTLLKASLNYLGQDASPSDLAPDELGCAESASNIIKKVVSGFPIVTGTWTLYDVLEHHPKFKRTTNVAPGVIIICPTIPGKKIPGHVGIIGQNNTIMSNDSFTGKWMSNYTLDSWKARYEKLGGYKSVFYTLEGQ